MSELEQARWEVKTDKDAEWALNKIRAARAECAKWCAHYTRLMDAAKAEAANTESYFSGLLERYFDTVPTKHTKTQESYSLPSGKLVRKRQPPEFARDDEALVPWLKSAAPELVKITETANWGELKKRCTVADGAVVDAQTGEVVPGVTATPRPDLFTVAMSKEGAEDVPEVPGVRGEP